MQLSGSVCDLWPGPPRFKPRPTFKICVVDPGLSMAPSQHLDTHDSVIIAPSGFKTDKRGEGGKYKSFRSVMFSITAIDSC